MIAQSSRCLHRRPSPARRAPHLTGGYGVVIALTANECAICATSSGGYAIRALPDLCFGIVSGRLEAHSLYRAQQAGKLETWALFAGSQGGTVARAGGNTCGPLSAGLDLKAPAVPRSDTDHTGPSISPHRCQWQGREGFRAQAVQALELTGPNAVPDPSAYAATRLRLCPTRALQAWLGHKNIQHTVRYTELAPDRFRDFWR
jgi:hypothetical protein